ncbi:uncharacterized protein LOC143231461 [Tachypleus tridentatus]|uniref:uncharacterized protein LOC143231461 n=1 Tax=Tachypleus tridentatus TaxID=6853 RepID=UPI003FD67A35
MVSSGFRKSGQVILFSAILWVSMLECSAQFFTKTNKVVPRLGRRTPPFITNTDYDLRKSLRHLVTLLRNNDMDGDGKLSLTELFASPLFDVFVASDQEPVHDQMDTNFQDTWPDSEVDLITAEHLPTTN